MLHPRPRGQQTRVHSGVYTGCVPACASCVCTCRLSHHVHVRWQAARVPPPSVTKCTKFQHHMQAAVSRLANCMRLPVMHTCCRPPPRATHCSIATTATRFHPDPPLTGRCPLGCPALPLGLHCACLRHPVLPPPPRCTHARARTRPLQGESGSRPEALARRDGPQRAPERKPCPGQLPPPPRSMPGRRQPLFCIWLYVTSRCTCITIVVVPGRSGTSACDGGLPQQAMYVCRGHTCD